MIVIDASVAIAWCFADESSAESDAVLDSVRGNGARVPSLWHLEVANVLRQAERRSRISEAATANRLELLAELPIITDGETVLRAWNSILALARAQTLTVYDATYLELAARLGVAIASKDRKLLAAATKLGMPTIAC